MARKRDKSGKLYYKGRSVNPVTFTAGRKDLRRLVGYCQRCGCTLVGSAALPRADPYDSDINHDDTPVVQCVDCHYQSNQET
jgi:hypothetical protein